MFGVVVVMTVSYLAVLAVGRVRHRWAVGALVVAYALLVLFPPLLSKDVYLYLAYGRLGVIHHLNPYISQPAAAPDPILSLVGWPHQLSPYGPIFTLGTYPLALTSIANALWLIKIATVAAALGCVALVWKCAQLLNRPAIPAALAVGLNPLFLIYGVNGSHNDLLMMLALMAGVYLALAARERLSAAAAVVAVGIKLAAAPIAPFVLLASRDRGRAVSAGAAAAAILGSLGLLVFGPHLFGITQQANTVTRYSVPRLVGLPFGAHASSSCATHTRPCHAGPLTVLPTVILGLTVLLLLIWVWRGGDPITAAGWAGFALVVTLTSIQPWYFIWVLPLAVLSRSRSLHVATACLGAFLLLTAWPSSAFLMRHLG